MLDVVSDWIELLVLVAGFTVGGVIVYLLTALAT
jgi:hypothetical protein